MYILHNSIYYTSRRMLMDVLKIIYEFLFLIIRISLVEGKIAHYI